jgi:hypothetical protein
MLIREAAEDWSGEELGSKVGSGEQGDLQDGSSELSLGIERQNGEDHPRSKDVGKDDQQNGQELAPVCTVPVAWLSRQSVWMGRQSFLRSVARGRWGGGQLLITGAW